jgi:hypothetical protein
MKPTSKGMTRTAKATSAPTSHGPRRGNGRKPGRFARQGDQHSATRQQQHRACKPRPRQRKANRQQQRHERSRWLQPEHQGFRHFFQPPHRRAQGIAALPIGKGCGQAKHQPEADPGHQPRPLGRRRRAMGE